MDTRLNQAKRHDAQVLEHFLDVGGAPYSTLGRARVGAEEQLAGGDRRDADLVVEFDVGSCPR
jgi:hypothetical protein